MSESNGPVEERKLDLARPDCLEGTSTVIALFAVQPGTTTCAVNPPGSMSTNIVDHRSV